MVCLDELRGFGDLVLLGEPSVWDEGARGLGIHGCGGKVIGGLVVRAAHMGPLQRRLRSDELTYVLDEEDELRRLDEVASQERVDQ
jgi:hypothetical protein